MSDTPSPDIPDPASPTPEGAPASAAKPRRVITRPDTAIRAPLPGTRVITRPDADKSSRLPGTFAANYGDDPSWRRGVTFLWALFGLAAVAEFFHALFIILSGQRGYPSPADMARLGAEAVVFLLLWAGWGWVRWVLVVVDFLFGAWFILRAVAPLPTDELRQLLIAHPELRHPGITMLPQLGLGVIYLVSAGYLALSADVIGFVRHRREEGRGWVVAPIALIVGAFIALICGLEPLCMRLFEAWRLEAGQFATESLRAMAQHWDVSAYDQRTDPEYLKAWPKTEREQTFGTLTGLGTLPSLPEVKTSVGVPSLNSTGDGFMVKYHCDFGRVKFSNGDIVLGYIVTHRLPGSWQLRELEALDLRPNPAPATAPDASAVPPPATP